MKVRRQRSVCLFCTAPAKSNEDMWPRWLLRAIGPVRLTVHRADDGGSLAKANALVLKAKIVCKQCNNGWMSRLENRVKPILLPMLKGEPVDLDYGAQFVLAQWAIKMSMVIEHVLAQDVSAYWTDSDRKAFANAPHRCPRATEVILGRYLGARWLAVLRGGLSHVARPWDGTPLAPATRATIICKGVILRVAANRYKETTGRPVLVWPEPHWDKCQPLAEDVEVIRWPLGPGLDEQQLDEFLSNRWNRTPAAAV